MRVEFFKHSLDDKDREGAIRILSNLFLTTGEEVLLFEREFASYLGLRSAIGVSSCTAALHLALLAAGVKPGDEVITSPLSFVATANAIEYCGAKPVFVDVDSKTGLMDVSLVEKAITSRTKAIIPVHLYGQLSDMRALRKVADEHALALIEDAAHAIEAERDGYRAGMLGDAACFSFYATKNITSGEGGVIALRTDEWKDRLLKLRLHGLSKSAAERYTKRYEHYDMEMLGWKYNMTNIQAALLRGQLMRINDLWKARDERVCRYREAFDRHPRIGLIATLPSAKSAHHLFTILVEPERRDQILSELQERGVGVAVNFRPIHLMQYYREKYGYSSGAYPNAEDVGSRTISLPLYPSLTSEEQDHCIHAVYDTV